MKNKIVFIVFLLLTSFSLVSKVKAAEIEPTTQKTFHPPQTEAERTLDGILWITSFSYFYHKNNNAQQPTYWGISDKEIESQNFSKMFTEEYLHFEILERNKCPYDYGMENVCDYDYNVGYLSYNTKSDDGQFAVIFSCAKASLDYCNTYSLRKNKNGIWQLDGFKCFKNKYCIANYPSKR